ncbi:TPA: glycosyltransferase family 4 protein [Photobacterium damselae]
MKKILYVINVDWYFNLHWIDRAKYFQSLGYSVIIATNFTTNKNKKDLEELGFTCLDLPFKRKNINLIYEAKIIFNLFKIIKKVNPDLIHTVTIKPNIYTGLLNKYFKKPIVYTIAGLGVVFSSSAPKFKYMKKLVIELYKLISNDNSRFIFENNHDSELFSRYRITKSNSVVIKGAGVDVDKYFYKNCNGNKNILFAARLLKDKGLDTLVSAISVLRSKNINCQLNVAGIIDDDASSSIPLSEINKLHEENKINWLGTVNDMVPLIHHNDIVCLPTRYGEGVPRILIEAASCGRPIIATDIAGCNNLITDGFNGYLVRPNDVDELAYKLELLLADINKLNYFGENGRNKILSEYSQSIVFESTHIVYKHLLKTF